MTRPSRRLRAIAKEFRKNMERAGLGVSIKVNDEPWVRITEPRSERKQMAKTRATIDKSTGEVVEDRPMITGDLADLERAIATAYGELVSLKEAKDEATLEHKEGQERLNALVAELTRRVNGEQPLPL